MCLFSAEYLNRFEVTLSGIILPKAILADAGIYSLTVSPNTEQEHDVVTVVVHQHSGIRESLRISWRFRPITVYELKRGTRKETKH